MARILTNPDLQSINIYCDESCHLEHDSHTAMVVGAVWCRLENVKTIHKRIADIKERHGFGRSREVKWTRVSPGKLEFYLDLLDYFFDTSDLCFRCIVVPEKAKLRHDDFNQTHDEFYYKLYYLLISRLLKPQTEFNIYLDEKDTLGASKVAHLKDVLRSANFDLNGMKLGNFQTVKSSEVAIVQLADILTGAVSYVARGLATSEAKLELVKKISARSKYSLTRSSVFKEEKFNIFYWRSQNEGQQ